MLHCLQWHSIPQDSAGLLPDSSLPPPASNDGQEKGVEFWNLHLWRAQDHGSHYLPHFRPSLFRVWVIVMVNGAYGLWEAVEQFRCSDRYGHPTISVTCSMFPEEPDCATLLTFAFPTLFVADIFTYDITQYYTDMEALCKFLAPKQLCIHHMC